MSFQPSITLHGIEEAIQGLGYRNESGLKYRLIAAIRERYGTNGEFREPLQGIEAETLIPILWDVDPDPDSIRSRKKNLSSIKSSVNSDLKRLYREGKNPEGITIGPENLFTISDEAKDDLLASIRTGGAATLLEIRKVAGILSGIVSKEGFREGSYKEEISSDLERVGRLLKSISEKMGQDEGDSAQARIESVLKGSAEEEGRMEVEPSAPAEDLEGLEGEFPEADPDELALDSDEAVVQELVIEETADLTEVAEGEVYETPDEDDDEEIVEVVEDSCMPEEEIELLEPEIYAEGEAWVESPEISGEGTGSGGLDVLEGLEEPVEIEEELAEAEDVEAEEYEEAGGGLQADGEEGGAPGEAEGLEEPVEIEEELAEAEEEDAEEYEEAGGGLQADRGEGGAPGEAEELEGPVEIEEELAEAEEVEAEEYEDVDEVFVEEGACAGEATLEAQESPDAGATADEWEGNEGLDEVADALEVDEEEEICEIEEEEEAPEAYEDGIDVTFDPAVGEGTVPEGEEQGSEGEIENAPVQSMSVGDEAGGTETAGKGKARILAERFNNSLSEMDRFYNEYPLVPAGEYTIGAQDQRGRGNPARRVQLSAFYIGRFPVTNALFDVFVEKTGYVTTAERVGYGVVCYGRKQRRLDAKTGREIVTWNSSLTSKIVQGAFWYQPSGPGSNLHHKRNHPVVQVSLEDAMAFAAWTGKRLPSEEEWEAASRTMKGALYPWGNRWRKDACNMEESGVGDTTPVDHYLDFENEYQIADTVGNVFEWTTGRFETREETTLRTVLFITKGASWATSKPVTLAGRVEFVPEFHSNTLGFRCVAN
jgi:formylglycine-generating enzyme required for sulfatase activity